MKKRPSNQETTKSQLRNRLGNAPHSKVALRLWLRLLTCSSLVEGEVRKRLHKEWQTTLPRFDFTAALYRAPEGLTMSEVANRLMVTKGNITSIADYLEAEKIIVRTRSKSDRRTQIVKLTAKGKQQFEKRASKHEVWIDRMFQDLSSNEIETLLTALTKLQASVEKELG